MRVSIRGKKQFLLLFTMPQQLLWSRQLLRTIIIKAKKKLGPVLLSIGNAFKRLGKNESKNE